MLQHKYTTYKNYTIKKINVEPHTSNVNIFSKCAHFKEFWSILGCVNFNPPRADLVKARPGGLTLTHTLTGSHHGDNQVTGKREAFLKVVPLMCTRVDASASEVASKRCNLCLKCANLVTFLQYVASFSKNETSTNDYNGPNISSIVTRISCTVKVRGPAITPMLSLM